MGRIELNPIKLYRPIFGWVYLFFFDYVSSVLLMFIVDNEIGENNKE